MPDFGTIETPAVLIDLARVEANLNKAQAHATAHGYALRPHIKTHKIPRFAQRQMQLGAVGITAQKLGEAEVMADAGLSDIFVPYNIVGPLKLKRLAALNDRVTMSVTADSAATIAGYAKTFAGAKRPLTVLVECDTGAGRCGVQSKEAALALAQQIAAAPGLRFGGLMTYPAMKQMDRADRWLGEAKALLEQNGIPVERITAGNSPDMWHDHDDNVTERRPGTYIYFDRSQVVFGAAGNDDIALTVLATVVSRPTPRRIVVDAGSKALGSDLMGLAGFGWVQGREDFVLTTLSEEHGVIELAAPSEWPAVGERIRLVPNHVCPVSNLHDRVHLVAADGSIEVVPVAARGRVD